MFVIESRVWEERLNVPGPLIRAQFLGTKGSQEMQSREKYKKDNGQFSKKYRTTAGIDKA